MHIMRDLRYDKVTCPCVPGCGFETITKLNLCKCTCMRRNGTIIVGELNANHLKRT